jgi:hypothetical protein
MFAMLSGRWPRTMADGSDVAALETAAETDADARKELREAIETLVADAVRAQEDAGLDLITDGQVRTVDLGVAVLHAVRGNDLGVDGPITRAWRATAALTDRTVAQVVPGPYSLGRRVTEGQDPMARSEFTLELAGHLGQQLRSLQAAGCPMVQVEEPAATAIGDDEAERELFATAQSTLLDAAPGLHAMLVIQGGSAWEAGADAILAAPYSSYLFDLISGPDNWYLVRAAPGDRGIVCAALEVPSTLDQGPTLDWAGRYASSSNGRGPSRVGLANATSLHTLTLDAAREALATLARAARLGAMAPTDAVAEGLDPRTFATGHGRANRRRGRSAEPGGAGDRP